MNMLHHSNGINRLKYKKNKNIPKVIKTTVYVIIFILLSLAVFQLVLGKVYNEKYKSRFKYTRIDEKKVFYNDSGSGELTIVFDSDLGLDLNEWNSIEKSFKEKYNIKTFQYNRLGYGNNDGGSRVDLKKQADDLRLTLKKANITGPYILVGSGYGSLVMTNFANTYPEIVKGVVLINPINEEYIKDKEYIKNFSDSKFKYKVEYISAYFGISYFREKLGLLKVPEGVVTSGDEELASEYMSNRIRSKYSQAIYNEIINLENGDSSSQIEGMLGDNPLAIVSREENMDKDKKLLALSKSRYITQISTNSKGQYIPVSDKEKTLEAINYVLEKAKVNAKK
ncbi:alpha/beta fold hydrolase [Clostridium sp. 'White wine YQ']|uniref:alpha/beta fold hydrolase n=1 Tax=Clostridium sp. 'White wine YQ' TaxID=3027474 RepID=UPI0023652266|nr:alpha/beta hydrolase [Clostridium sp. 'White wine YQ']MDD7792643.1 alpha/beta hydrolase [Clostridium sp. 'White wine YQ']